MPQSFAEQIKSIPMSPNLGESLDGRTALRASRRIARSCSSTAAGPDRGRGSRAPSCRPATSISLRLGTDVSGYLGGLLEDMRAAAGDEPAPDAELLRVLQAAAQAAQQSRRRQIDGAIVLAAIVGDGKSPAAGLLKAHGLTFEEASARCRRPPPRPTPRPCCTATAPSGKPQPVTAAPATASSAGGRDAGGTCRRRRKAPPRNTAIGRTDPCAAGRARRQARSIMTPKTKLETAASPQPAAPAAVMLRVPVWRPGHY